MVICKNCGKEISKKASICPHCGVKIHPIKEIIKIIIIVLCVLISVVFVISILNGSLFKIIDKNIEIQKLKKYEGTYELVGNIDDYKNDYNGIIYGAQRDKKNYFKYNIEDIQDSIKIEQSGDLGRYDDHYYINRSPYVVYYKKYDYINLIIGFYVDTNVIEDREVGACFKLNGDYLEQTDCHLFASSYDYIENIGLKYKKIK